MPPSSLPFIARNRTNGTQFILPEKRRPRPMARPSRDCLRFGDEPRCDGERHGPLKGDTTEYGGDVALTFLLSRNVSHRSKARCVQFIWGDEGAVFSLKHHFWRCGWCAKWSGLGSRHCEGRLLSIVTAWLKWVELRRSHFCRKNTIVVRAAFVALAVGGRLLPPALVV